MAFFDIASLRRSPYSLTVPLLLLGFLAAVFFYGTDNIWFAPSFLALMAFGAAVLAPGLKTGWSVPRTPVFVFAALYWLYLLVSLLWSTAPFVSLLFFGVFSILPLLFFAFVIGDDGSGKSLTIYAGSLLAVLTVLAAGAVGQYFFFYELLGPRIHQPLLDPNNFAALLNMGLLPVCSLYMMAEDKRRAGIFLVLAAVFGAALAATESRGGILSAGVGFAAMLPFVMPYKRASWTKLAVLACVLAAVALLLQFYGMAFHHYGPAHNFVAAGQTSISDRRSLWLSTLHMIRDHAMMGPGLGTFYYYYSAYRLPADQSDGYFAHMDPLQMGAEAGLIAPLLFYAILIAVFCRTIRALRAPCTSAQRAVIGGGFACLLAQALHAHVNFNLYLPVTLVPLACLLAFWYAATERVLHDRPAPAGRTQAGYVGFAALVVLGFLATQWIIRTAIGIHYINEAVVAEGQGDADAMRRATETAAFIAPVTYDRAWEYQARWRALALQQGEQADAAQKRRWLEDGLAAIHRAQALNKGFSYMRNEEAHLDALGEESGVLPGGLARAEVLLQGVLKDNPLDIDARVGLSQLYQKRGELKQALDVLKGGLNWPRPKGQTDIDYLVMTATLCRTLGDDDGYQVLINAAGAEAVHEGLTTSP